MKEIIRRIIQEIFCENGVEISSIILFGSRARGDAVKHSDWDLLVVTKKDISREEKRKISHIIRKRLADKFIPCDVLIKSEKEVEERKNVVGSVIKSAVREGVVL